VTGDAIRRIRGDASMGLEQNKRDEARDRKRAAKEKPLQSVPSDRLESLRKRTGASVADWASIDPQLLQGLVAAITSADCALMLSYSRDGGAYGLTIFDDGDRERIWISCTSDVEAELRYIASLW
jgi:hypothetical protein